MVIPLDFNNVGPSPLYEQVRLLLERLPEHDAGRLPPPWEYYPDDREVRADEEVPVDNDEEDPVDDEEVQEKEEDD